MWATVSIKLLLLSVFVISVKCEDGEYYWRPWTAGSPPSDAITLRDYKGLSYIVEGYVPNYGSYIGQVFANQHEVNVTVANSNKTSTFIVKDSHSLKVLCTNSLKKLAWYPTSYSVLQNELITAVINPVIGGINVHDEIVYIGKYSDTTLRLATVGSVVRDNVLHYHRSGKVGAQSYFEILVIDGKCNSN